MTLLARHIAGAAGVLIVLLCLADAAEAQRPFSTLDPFYQEETARRGFYDGFALQADVAYRASEPSIASGGAFTPLALSVRFDYALARQLDVAAVVDVSPGINSGLDGSPVRVGWLIAKPYWHYGNTDYAVRLAIDPASDSGFGFRQTDVAFISTSDLSPTLSTDLVLGFRRARVGFERLRIGREVELLLSEAMIPSIVRSRASGTELHMMWGYRYYLDPGGSHVFTTLAGEAMTYTLVSSNNPSDPVIAARGPDFDPTREGRLRGGVARLNVGIEYSRPSFMLAPYVSLPVFRWIHIDGDDRTYGPRLEHARMGMRVTVR